MKVLASLRERLGCCALLPPKREGEVVFRLCRVVLIAAEYGMNDESRQQRIRRLSDVITAWRKAICFPIYNITAC